MLGAACTETGEELGLAEGPVATAVRLGGPGTDRALALALTETGEPIVAGEFSGTLRLGPDFEFGPFASGIFIARLDEAGVPVWVYAPELRGASLAQVRLTIDPSDAPILGATVQGGELEIDGQRLRGDGVTDLFLLRLTPDGELDQARRIGGRGRQVMGALATGGDGSVWMSGRFSGGLEIEGADPLVAQGRSDGFIARLDRRLETGQLGWIRAPGGFAAPTAMAVDQRTGQALLALRFEREAIAGNFRLTAPAPLGATGVLFYRNMVEPSGSFALSDSSGQLELVDAAFDADGLGHLGGLFRGTLSVGGRERRSQSFDGLWLRAPSAPPSGRREETGIVGGARADRIRALATDRRGRTWLAGSFEEALRLRGSTLQSVGPRAAFAARVDSDGASRFGVDIQGVEVFSADIQVGRSGVWWLGGFTDTLRAGRFELSSEGGLDVALLRFEPR